MNVSSLSGLRPVLRARARYWTRRFLARRRSTAFSSTGDHTAIERIYIINLDRAQERWTTLNHELRWLRDREGHSLNKIARRYSAIDARYLDGPPPADHLKPTYTLAEQLSVDPHPRLVIDDDARATQIGMTPQEIAVALSHIEVWKLIAESDTPYTLVLEDDVYITRSCMSVLHRAWAEMRSAGDTNDAVDLLYLSYRETGEPEAPIRTGSALRRPTRGLWQLSGYVLSRAGAAKLLDLLPAHGPIDLWMNLQFDHLAVRMTDRSIIEQRAGVTSSNSYSILPILSKVGATQYEAPRLARRRSTKAPIIVVGAPGTGLSAVAEALSVLGFRCISDLTDLPPGEYDALLRGSRRRMFDAYVNIGSLGSHAVEHIASRASLRVIVTTASSGKAMSSETPGILSKDFDIPPHRCIVLPLDDPDPWQRIAEFIGCDYPSHPWPRQPDQGQRPIAIEPPPRGDQGFSGQSLTWDTSLWTLERTGWAGIALESARRPGTGSASGDRQGIAGAETIKWRSQPQTDDTDWYRRDDTFPSNKALFRPQNVTLQPDGLTTLAIRCETNQVRDLTGAAIASRQSFTYGTYAADLRVPSGSGLVSGLFLHRNGPRQEIDIEFLGKDTTKMLVNVFYNPGTPGTKLEYGYRGTPVLIDLGFDASAAFHRYEIEWRPECIRWNVDGVTVHERLLWGPTPIPDQPMEFNVNLWSSESTEFAGPLDEGALPAVLKVASLEAVVQPGVSSLMESDRAR